MTVRRLQTNPIRLNQNRYVIITCIVVVAFLARLALTPFLGSAAPFITLFPAVVYAAWVGGFSGGLTATLLSLAISLLFIFHRPGRPEDSLAVLRFGVVGIVISVLGHAQSRAQRERIRLAEQRRNMLRDLLLAVTEGKLSLCHTVDELPTLVGTGGSIPIEAPFTGISQLRRTAYDAAVALDFPVERCEDLMTAVSEAAMNAATHAGGGSGRVYSDSAARKIQVIVIDQGAGIEMESLSSATLIRGFSTKASLGHGLKMMIELVDHVYLHTGARGTTVVLEQSRTPELPPWLRDVE